MLPGVQAPAEYKRQQLAWPLAKLTVATPYATRYLEARMARSLAGSGRGWPIK
jgi:hypothetical protein